MTSKINVLSLPFLFACVLAGESAKAYSFLPDVVDPLDKASRWDGLDRNPPVLNGDRSLVGGRQYNFEGGSIGTFYN